MGFFPGRRCTAPLSNPFFVVVISTPCLRSARLFLVLRSFSSSLASRSHLLHIHPPSFSSRFINFIRARVLRAASAARNKINCATTRINWRALARDLAISNRRYSSPLSPFVFFRSFLRLQISYEHVFSSEDRTIWDAYGVPVLLSPR